jgi:formylmethanofuran dehydrogenase subunit E
VPLKTFDEYLELAALAHGHACAGQVLGVRMALCGLRLLGLEDPGGLVVIAEIDRCATDAIPVVTGCRLSRRSLRFRDFGKVAATFYDRQAGRAVRLVAKEDARERARALHPEISDRRLQQIRAYREMPDEELFAWQWVRVTLGPEDLPGYKAPRAICQACGESVQFKREIVREGRVLCRACAGERYYEPL